MTTLPIATSAAAVARRRDAHIDAGMELMRSRRYPEAAAEFRAAADLDPGDHRPLVNLGTARILTGDADGAAACCERALSIDPYSAEAMTGLAVARKMQGRFDEAIAGHRAVLRMRPDDLRAATNLAGVLEVHGTPEEAALAFMRVLDLDPANTEAMLGLGIARLAMGDMGGMAGHDARLDRPTHLAAEVPGIPRWDGRDMAGGTLLVNQYLDGFGDAIMGIRSAPAARARCDRLVVACHPNIARLMARAEGVDAVVTESGELEPIISDMAAQCPPLGLPWYCGLGRIEDIPALAPSPYLGADPADADRWRETRSIGGGSRLRVGLVWQGNPNHANDRNRSFRLADMAPLADVAGVDFVSLQKGVGTDQIADAAFDIFDLNKVQDYRDGDLLETAAAMMNLDLIISADTGLAHLAGAIGRPVWLALPHRAEWRWLSGRDDSPWYPTARLFRQPTPRGWAAVFRRMADELARVA